MSLLMSYYGDTTPVLLLDVQQSLLYANSRIGILLRFGWRCFIGQFIVFFVFDFLNIFKDRSDKAHKGVLDWEREAFLPITNFIFRGVPSGVLSIDNLESNMKYAFLLVILFFCIVGAFIGYVLAVGFVGTVFKGAGGSWRWAWEIVATVFMIVGVLVCSEILNIQVHTFILVPVDPIWGKWFLRLHSLIPY